MHDEPAPEHSSSGDRIIRHAPREQPFEAAFAEEAHLAAVGAHIARHVGRPETVFHELISDLVHIDIHVVTPTDVRPYTTLVTSGMSARPMSPPEGAEHMAWAELALCLPSDWPLSQEAFEQEENYWPLRWLKILARMPHEYETWLGYGHTVPNGDPPEPFAANTKLCGFALSGPRVLPEDFMTLKLDDGRTVYFYMLLPLYKEEMDLKLRKGIDALEQGLFRVGATEVVDINRPNAARRSWWRRRFVFPRWLRGAILLARQATGGRHD